METEELAWYGDREERTAVVFPKIVQPSYSHVVGFSFDRFISLLVFSVVLKAVNSSGNSFLLFTLSCLAVAISLVILFVVGRQYACLQQMVLSSPFLVGCSLVVAVGIVLQHIFWVTGESVMILFVLSVLFMAIPSALIILGWGVVFSSVGSKMALIEVFSGFLLAFALCVPFTFLPAEFQTIMLVIVALLNGVFVIRALQKREVDTTEDKSIFSEKKALFINAGLGLFCMGAAMGLSSTLFQYAENALSASGSLLRLFCAAILAVAAILVVTLARRQATVAVYRLTFLFVTLGSLFTLVLPAGSVVVAAILFIGSSAIMNVGGSTLLGFAHQMPGRAFQLVAYSVAAIVTGNVTIRFLYRCIEEYVPGVVMPYELCVVLLAALFIVLHTVVFTEEHINELENLPTKPREGLDFAPEDNPAQDDSAWISKRYLLTQRETDVLRLLLAGRSSRRIQEELLVSESTAHTHIRHIYTKLNIHSKQELIDIVEEGCWRTPVGASFDAPAREGAGHRFRKV
ncbi:MAG: LuxR C-terminal-related transcriptional regulator [Coriobacteriales bacterium]|jgi:DNA-binding CsgD family transcriptional regulator|nr:LuxR C-terminal-related transcriptional regulator [Coriobacteriales bacterium]